MHTNVHMYANYFTHNVQMHQICEMLRKQNLFFGSKWSLNQKENDIHVCTLLFPTLFFLFTLYFCSCSFVSIPCFAFLSADMYICNLPYLHFHYQTQEQNTQSNSLRCGLLFPLTSVCDRDC